MHFGATIATDEVTVSSITVPDRCDETPIGISGSCLSTCYLVGFSVSFFPNTILLVMYRDKRDEEQLR